MKTQMNKTVNRREFLEKSLMGMFGAVAISITACGRYNESLPEDSGSGGGTQSDSAPSTSKSGAISANHGHSAVVSSAQLDANQGVTLNIQGSSAHPHQITLSASQVQAIRNGTRVSVSSSIGGGHVHDVTFN